MAMTFGHLQSRGGEPHKSHETSNSIHPSIIYTCYLVQGHGGWNRSHHDFMPNKTTKGYLKKATGLTQCLAQSAGILAFALIR